LTVFSFACPVSRSQTQRCQYFQEAKTWRRTAENSLSLYRFQIRSHTLNQRFII
jgi:hypothetical protein